MLSNRTLQRYYGFRRASSLPGASIEFHALGNVSLKNVPAKRALEDLPRRLLAQLIGETYVRAELSALSRKNDLFLISNRSGILVTLANFSPGNNKNC